MLLRRRRRRSSFCERDEARERLRQSTAVFVVPQLPVVLWMPFFVPESPVGDAMQTQNLGALRGRSKGKFMVMVTEAVSWHCLEFFAADEFLGIGGEVEVDVGARAGLLPCKHQHWHHHPRSMVVASKNSALWTLVPIPRGWPMLQNQR